MSRIKHEIINGNIHHFTLLSASKDTFDELINTVRAIFDFLDTDMPLHAIVDLTQSGFFSLPMIINNARQLRQQFQEHETRVLIIHQDYSMASALNVLLGTLPRTKIRFILPEKESEYLSWLLTGELLT